MSAFILMCAVLVLFTQVDQLSPEQIQYLETLEPLQVAVPADVDVAEYRRAVRTSIEIGRHGKSVQIEISENVLTEPWHIARYEGRTWALTPSSHRIFKLKKRLSAQFPVTHAMIDRQFLLAIFIAFCIGTLLHFCTIWLELIAALALSVVFWVNPALDYKPILFIIPASATVAGVVMVAIFKVIFKRRRKLEENKNLIHI